MELFYPETLESVVCLCILNSPLLLLSSFEKILLSNLPGVYPRVSNFFQFSVLFLCILPLATRG